MYENELIPEGYYLAKPTASGFINTTNNHDQFAIECEITDGEFAGKRLTKFQGVETDDGIIYAIRDMRTCGWKGTDIATADVDPEATVKIRVVHETYRGETKVKLKSIFSPDSGEPGMLIQKQAMDETRKREISKRMNAMVKQVDAGTLKPSAKPANGTKPTTQRQEPQRHRDSDDDIPF